MRFFTLLLLTLLAVCGCLVLGNFENSVFLPDDGYYEGIGQGYRGPITVQVIVNGGNIAEIYVLESFEDIFVGGEAIDELIDNITAYNSFDVDVITGATYSSRGFLDAIKNALIDN